MGGSRLFRALCWRPPLQPKNPFRVPFLHFSLGQCFFSSPIEARGCVYWLRVRKFTQPAIKAHSLDREFNQATELLSNRVNISSSSSQIAFTVRWSKHVSFGLCLWTFTIYVFMYVIQWMADFKLHCFPESAIRDSFSVFAPLLTCVSHVLASYQQHLGTALVCMLYHEYYVKWMAVRLLGTFLVQLFNKKWNCWTIKFHS